jgi:hypothetical protein
MKKILVQQWADALVSGVYRRGEGLMRKKVKGKTKECWCPLGVLCDIVDPEGWAKPLPGSNEFLHHGQGLFPGFLVQLTTGIDEPTLDAVANLNDSGFSFDKIANLLLSGRVREEWDSRWRTSY